MTTWLLVLIVMASLAGVGYRQGGIRVAGSFLGIVLGALLAIPLGKLLKPLLGALGLKTPVLPNVIAPLIIFVLFSVIFKVAALMVHQKADVYYKYRAGDLRLALWERLNHRLGLCLGLLNGAAYVVLIAFVIYPFSYWTVQMATSDADPRSVRILNRLGQDLQATGFTKVARALDPLPQVYYDTADLIGLIYQNPLLEARLERYPAFLGLAERPEFQDIAKDKDFTEMRQRQDPIMNVINHPKVQAILQNAELLKVIGATLIPDLRDLRTYLETGKSAKYDPEKILGRWKFDVNTAMTIMRRLKPNIPSTEMKKVKQYMIATIARTGLVAMTDHQALLKNASAVKLPGGGGQQTMTCQWSSVDGKYQLAVAGSDLPVTIEGDRMMIGAESLGLVFVRED